MGASSHMVSWHFCFPSWAILGPSKGNPAAILGLSLGHPGFILGHSGGTLGLFWEAPEAMPWCRLVTWLPGHQHPRVVQDLGLAQGGIRMGAGWTEGGPRMVPRFPRMVGGSQRKVLC